MTGIQIALFCGIGLFLLLWVGAIVAVIFRTLRLKHTYTYSVKGHNVVVRLAARGCFLHVDGVLEDQYVAQTIRAFTLRSYLEGAQLKVHVFVRFHGAEIHAFYDNAELQPIQID